MVYSSIPTYLDPSNWQQQPNDQSRGSGSSDQLNHQLVVSIAQSVPPPQPPPPPHEPQPHVAGGCMGGSIRPGSMAERARLANIPLPEAPLKCPRCESTNTKFCYFNNYSLTQPRHFCKTCKRYWTRGGALRSVPVGGGCRRNKRSKAGGGANSKSSPAATSSDHRQTPCSSTSTVSSNSTGPGNLLGLMPPQIPALRFLSPLGQLSSDHYNSGLSSPLMGFCEPNFQTNSLSGFDSGGGLGSLGGSIEQWRLQNLQQFPFLGGGGGGGLDSSTAGLHQFQGSIIEPSSLIGQTSPNHVRPEVSSSILTQMAAIKMEENQGLNLSRQMIMGISRNDPWTGTTAWNDFTTFSSSSTSNPLLQNNSQDYSPH